MFVRLSTIACALSAVWFGCGSPDDPAGEAPSQLLAAICDVRSFGARGDGHTDDTRAIQKAIDRCPRLGTVRLPAHHVFSAGMLALKSDLTFEIEAGAILRAIRVDTRLPTREYPTIVPGPNDQEANCKRAFVYARGVKNVELRGPGTIDGNGDFDPWLAHGRAKHYPSAYSGAYVAPPPDGGERPVGIYFAYGKDVRVRDLRLENAAKWGLVALEIDGLEISKVTIDSDLPGNRDGMDIVDSHHVRIDRCTVRSEDDAICFKSGSHTGVEDVVVSNSIVLKSTTANGIKFGTSSFGSLRHAVFEDVIIRDVAKSAIALESVDGAQISDIEYRRIQVTHAGAPFFVLLGYRGLGRPAGAQDVGSIADVRFRDITAEDLDETWGSLISGTEIGGHVHAIHSVSFDNVRLVAPGADRMVPPWPPEYKGQYPEINMWNSDSHPEHDMPAFGYTLRHVEGGSFHRCTTEVARRDARPAIVRAD